MLSVERMRTATVFTNLTCNQHCGFCTFRRAEDAPGFTSSERIRAEIERARGAEVLVFSGGEPTLLAELPEHIRHARSLGIERIVVETNGMLFAYEGRARALVEAGVSAVRVALNAAVADKSDALTATPGGHALTLRGIAAARDAGLPVELSVAVVRENIDALPALASALPDGVTSVLLRVVTDAGAAWVPHYEDAARAVTAFVDRARERGVPVALDGRHGIPLCFFPERRRYPELFAGGAPRDAHGMVRIAECDGCAARERCPGVPEAYVALHGERGAAKVPARQERFVIGLGRDRRGAVERELINDAFIGDAGGGIERVLRVDFHCNQACAFCFVDRTLPAVAPERIEAEIRRAAAEGIALLSLSGGEPTLHPRLPDFVRSARAAGLRTQIQSNAVRCAEPGYARELAAAGLERAFVSLHGARAAVSDEITAAPGTFDRTVKGVTALLDAGVEVLLNHVITGANYAELPAFARFVVERWRGRVSVNLSFVHASTDLVPRDVEMIPRLSDARPFIAEAIAVLRAAGVAVHGFDGQCGMPLCVLGDDWLDRASLAPLPEPNPPAGFSKVEACQACSLNDRCVGIRDTYAALHGSAELRAV